jgi:hypothetical protein
VIRPTLNHVQARLDDVSIYCQLLVPCIFTVSTTHCWTAEEWSSSAFAIPLAFCNGSRSLEYKHETRLQLTIKSVGGLVGNVVLDELKVLCRVDIDEQGAYNELGLRLSSVPSSAT